MQFEKPFMIFEFLSSDFALMSGRSSHEYLSSNFGPVGRPRYKFFISTLYHERYGK